VFGQQGVADLDRVAQEPEVDLLRHRQSRHDRQPDGRVDEVVQLVAGVCGHRAARIRQAA
jgi:hypothetical protein